MKKLTVYLAHPIALAIPFSILVLLLVPPVFRKYIGNVEKAEPLYHGHEPYVQYIDLDKDGNSEKIYLFNYRYNSAMIRVYDHEGALIDDFNFGRKFYSNFRAFGGDYNKDSFQEIYFFTLQKDSSIWVNQLDFFSDNASKKKSRFISKIKFNKNDIDISIFKIGLLDLNNDGFKEILFYLAAGYSLQPRNIYAWDIKNDTVLISPESYAKLSNFKMVDLDQDGIFEITGGCSASGNVKDTATSPYHDQSAWLMIFDNRLKFKYLPVEYKDYGTNIWVEPFNNGEGNKLCILEYNFLSGKRYAKIYILNEQLKKEKEKELCPGRIYLCKAMNGRETIFLVHDFQNEIVSSYNSDLIEISEQHSIGLIRMMDVDLDGVDEILAWNSTVDKLSIFRSGFSHPVEYSIPQNSGKGYEVKTVRQRKGFKPQLAYQRGNMFYLLNYDRNPYYFLKFPFYLMVYSLFVLLFHLVLKLQKKRIEEKYANEREITQLQIRTIKNQADPHFIFNALNSISSIIYKEDKDTAYNVLNDFSRLIRSVIVNSDKIQISLAEELEFIENYLKLEKIRFKDKFSYKIEVGNGVNQQIKVPRMVIQAYIENAIKHGIMHANYPCKLAVRVESSNEYLTIEIDDNGIGREKAKEFAKYSTGKGLSIMNRIYQLYYKLYGKKIHHTIEDKTGLSEPSSGTKVTVSIPL